MVQDGIQMEPQFLLVGILKHALVILERAEEEVLEQLLLLRVGGLDLRRTPVAIPLGYLLVGYVP